MSGKRRGNGPFKMTLAQQARTMSYYNPAIKKENFLTADRNEIQQRLPGLQGLNRVQNLDQKRSVNESQKGHSLFYHRKIYYEKLPRKLWIGHFLNILF